MGPCILCTRTSVQEHLCFFWSSSKIPWSQYSKNQSNMSTRPTIKNENCFPSDDSSYYRDVISFVVGNKGSVRVKNILKIDVFEADYIMGNWLLFGLETANVTLALALLHPD